MVLPSTDHFEKMERFKQLFMLEIRAQMKAYVGIQLFQDHIQEHLDDFLVALEGELEQLAQQSIHDEELNYEPFQEE